MFDNIIFFNHYGAGDLFESREFVKAIINMFPDKGHFYAHSKGEQVLLDIPVNYIMIDSNPDSIFLQRQTCYYNTNSLMVNTWIGRDSKYVLPNIGCTVEQNFRMFNDMLFGLEKRLSGVPYDYVPNINYSFYSRDFEKLLPGTKKILICNGNVQSCQAFNFDFTPTIWYLGDKYRDITFYITTDIANKPENVKFTGDVIKKGSFDLNEISYLSTFCDIIVGRKSGPFVFCGTKNNWEDASKTFISFTYGKEASSFVSGQNTKAKKVWSPETDIDSIIDVIEKEIK